MYIMGIWVMFQDHENGEVWLINMKKFLSHFGRGEKM